MSQGGGATISASLARRPKPYQLPMMLSNIPGGVPCNGAASGAARGTIKSSQVFDFKGKIVF
jgi:hypothetical protein